jgi:hypothetical protein
MALTGLGVFVAPAAAAQEMSAPTAGSQEVAPCGTFFVVHDSHPGLGPWASSAIFGVIFGQPSGQTVTVSVDDPQTSASPDFTATTSTDSTGNYSLVPLGDTALRAGDLVTATDSDVSCTLTTTISNLVVTQVDPFADTVQGTAQPMSRVTLNLLVSPGQLGEDHTVTVGRNGRWLVSFSGVADLSIGASGFARQTDANGLGTWVQFGGPDWPPTTLSVTPNRGLSDGQTVTVTGGEFQPGTTVTFVECFGSASPTTCGSTYGNPSAVVDAHGHFTATVQVKRIITIAGPVDVDCQFSDCGLLAVGLGGSQLGTVLRLGEAHISFSANTCKKGGWQIFTDAQGNPFPDQGACISATVP